MPVGLSGGIDSGHMTLTTPRLGTIFRWLMLVTIRPVAKGEAGAPSPHCANRSTFAPTVRALTSWISSIYETQIKSSIECIFDVWTQSNVISHYYFNKCIGDDTKATARQSTNCIKKTKKLKCGGKRFSIWRMEFLHPAIWHVALEWHAIEFTQTSAILEFYFWLRFRSYHRSRRVILHQSAKFYPNWTTLGRKNDVMSIFKMAELHHLGFYGSNNGLFEKPMYDFL